MKHEFLWVVMISAVIASQETDAAKRLGPPIEELQSTPERISIVIAEAKGKPEANRILFSISERLSGKAPDEVLLRTDAPTFANVAVGRSYVVAWTSMRRSLRAIEGWEVDPDGPTTVQITGLGATALFEDSPEIRLLFKMGTSAAPVTAEKQLDALMVQMQRGDFRSRGLVIAELYLRDDLTAIMGPAQIGLLKPVLQDPQLDPQHRDFLLRSALTLPQDLVSPWLAEELRKVIIQHGTQYDLASFVPGLVRTAARGLMQAGAPSDVDLLSLLLYANNPGVAKAALATMDHFDPAAATTRAEQALERGWIHGETRLALQRYLSQPRKLTGS